MEKLNLNNIKLKLFCRTCLKTLNNNRNNKKYNIFTKSHLTKLLSTCTSLIIDENDELPKYLCNKCYTKLEDFYKFCQICIESAQKFNQILTIATHSNNVKDDDSHYHFDNSTENGIILGIEINNDNDKKEDNNIETIITSTKPSNHQQQQCDHHELQVHEKKIACSNIEQEVVNALVNMVQNPNLPKQKQLEQQQNQQSNENLNNEQNQHNYDEDDNEEKVFEAQLDALCEEDNNDDDDEYLQNDEEQQETEIDIKLIGKLENTKNEYEEIETENYENDKSNDSYITTNYHDDIIKEESEKEEEVEKEEKNHDDEDYDEKSRKKKRKRKSRRILDNKKRKIQKEIDDNRNRNDNENLNNRKRANQEVFNCEICDKRYFKKEKFEACMRSHKGLKVNSMIFNYYLFFFF